MEQQNRTRGIDIVKGQLLGESQYSELRAQIMPDDDILAQWYTIDLSAREKDEQHGRSKSLAKKSHASNESFNDFFQTLTMAVNRTMSELIPR